MFSLTECQENIALLTSTFKTCIIISTTQSTDDLFLFLLQFNNVLCSFPKLDHGVHTTDSRSTTVSESTSTSDHHQHVSPPLSRNRHPLSQSTVDSLHSCKYIINSF